MSRSASQKVMEDLLSVFNLMRVRILPSGAKLPVFCFLLFVSLAVPLTTRAAGSLSVKEARKLIARSPGLALKTSAVHVQRISPVDASTIEGTAEIAMAFRLEKNDQAQWRVAEMRTGQDGWEEIEFIFQAVRGELNASTCDPPDLAVQGKRNSDPSIKRARCLLADLLGVQLPSDAVRIKDVSSGLPLGSHPSALIEARVEADFRFVKDRGSWRVNGVRTGARAWADPEAILSEVNKHKAVRARAELQSIAKALEDFRGKRGFYIESKSEATLIDFLSPVYLSHVIRIDPWRRPYHYQGTRDHFSLSSTGADGKENTGDDIVLNGPTRTTARTTIPN